MILQGVEPYRVVEPLFEGVRVILSYRGETYSPAYIQGLSGAAFRVAGICPCAPTCSAAMGTADLIALLGYELECLAVPEEGDFKSVWPEHLARIKASIDAGRPALVWHAFTMYEYDVVAGYDDSDNLMGRGSYAGLEEYASAPQDRPTTAEPALHSYLIGLKTSALSAREAEVAALREAVRHAHDQNNADLRGGAQWVFLEGLLAYDRWVSDWANPEKTLGVGDCYCVGVYRSTHGAGAAFLREIAPRYPNVTDKLAAAATQMTAEVEALEECLPLLWWHAPKGPDAARNAQATILLTRARDAYARAIDQIEAALPALE